MVLADELCTLSAAALLDLYRSGEVSPVQAARAALDRIAMADGAVNAFVRVFEEEAMARAAESEARWRRGEPADLLDGLPVTVKDLALMRGYPTLRGSRTIEPDQPWDEDSPSTARLAEAGAVILGKTTTPEFGWKGVTDSPLTGITRNPWNTGRTSGGSSGGAAASVALGMGALAQGGDGAGSIRIPAAFCGVYGLVPGGGRVPYYPPSPSGTLSRTGCLTRTVGDAALMLTVLVRPDTRDPNALPWRGEDYREGLEDGIEGLRVAWSPSLGYARVDPEIAGPAAEAARVFEALGARVEEVPHVFDDPREAFEIVFGVGQARKYREIPEQRRDRLDPGFRAMAEKHLGLPLQDYLDAVTEGAKLGARMRAFMADWDLLLTPEMPLAAFEAGADYPAGRNMSHWLDWSPFTYPFNFTGNPSASLPCGFTADGLPVALQVVGGRYDEATVLRASCAFERARPFAMPPLPATA